MMENGQDDLSKTTLAPSDREEVYITGNPLVHFLARRFRATMGSALTSHHASDLSGLDAGCGEGMQMHLLHTQGYIDRMVGIDCDGPKIRYAAHMHNRFTYSIANLYALNFKNGVFDYVIASEVLEHLASPGKAMEELVRVAKPKAFFVLSVPLEPLFRIGNVLCGRYVDRLGRTPAHCNFWTRRRFRAFVEPYLTVEHHFGLATVPWQILTGTVKPA
jgi:2-polyprenyl-3-methyl-5-hydroxy-6-metoxy-1,4-benzoquinol methylase